MTKLSIIIPCYNCEGTLEAAVDSIYRQKAAIPFDVTMVDDGSDDDTFETMERLSRRYPRLRLLRHPKNLGGGAARNSAVANSNGELIFCLDADDIMGPELLRNLTDFWLAKRCAAVGVSRSVKFRKDSLDDVAYVNDFAGPGKRIYFESLLDGSDCSLYSTFLMTRKAFDSVGGYPTSHAFDTQGMAFRILGNGLTAYTCPDALYYHRVEFGESYYLREQRANRINWNWLQVLDEFIYLFRQETQRRILDSPLSSAAGEFPQQDIINSLKGDPSIYVRGYGNLIRIGWRGAAERFRNSADGAAQYWLGTHASRKGQHRAALARYAIALELGFDFQIIYYRILEASLRLSGRNLDTADGLTELLRYCRPAAEQPGTISGRLFHLLIRSSLLRGPALRAKRLKDTVWPRRHHA